MSFSIDNNNNNFVNCNAKKVVEKISIALIILVIHTRVVAVGQGRKIMKKKKKIPSA